MKNVHFSPDVRVVMSAGLRLANPDTDCDAVIAAFEKHAAAYLRSKTRAHVDPKVTRAAAEKICWHLRLAGRGMAQMEDVDRKRVAKQLPELEQTRYWMRFLSRVIAQMGDKAEKQIRPGAKPDEAELRRLFEKWGKAWTEGTNQPLRVSRQGVTWPSKENVLKLTPKSRTGAELHAFAAALLAIDRRISNKSLIYYLQHAQSTSTHLASKSKLPKKSAAKAA